MRTADGIRSGRRPERRPITRAVGVALAVGLAASVAACGTSGPPTSSDLLEEYVDSTDVKNDKFAGDTKGDRIANFASRGGPEQLPAMLLSASPCGDECTENVSVDKALTTFAGTKGKTYKRSILVKREDGSLELMTLYVGRKPDGSSVLVGPEGKSFTNGLAGFREGNDVLGSGDHILTASDPTSVSGRNKMVVVTGHTGSAWMPWVLGGAAAAVAAGVLVLRARRRAGYEGFDEA